MRFVMAISEHVNEESYTCVQLQNERNKLLKKIIIHFEHVTSKNCSNCGWVQTPRKVSTVFLV